MVLKFRVDKEHLDPECHSEYLEFELLTKGGGDPKYVDITITPITVEPFHAGTEIDCASPDGDFEINFCKAKNSAIAADPYGNLKLNYSGKFNDGTKFADLEGASTFSKFSCNSSNILSLDQISSAGYYLDDNTKYMYGSGTYNMNFGKYQYHFEPCNPTEIGDIECKVKCEEAVTIEYGAPVASKAGLCFEYKVKVTSRVNCVSQIAPQLPTSGYQLCYPTPTCTGIGKGGNRYYLTQGGPNDAFDKCIEKCDGGKYTSKCSKQCYKEVYNDSLLNYSTKKNSAVCCNDCYLNTSTWIGDGPGAYYGGSCASEYIPDGHGFCRHDYGGGNICQDTCWWSGCEGHYYLNPGYAQLDYNENMARYESAKSSCEAAASCSTTTAEFSISVDYKDKSDTVQTINFPYNGTSLETDKATKDSTPSTFGNANSTFVSEPAGCYSPSHVFEDRYFVEWGFPGSWINRKTGELSYVSRDSSNGWQAVPDKFCVPFDAKTVNGDWWNYYYSKLDPDFNPRQETLPSLEDSDNIRARAKKFGYYGWNIGVDCFYALPPDGTTISGEIDYIIRSVDLNDLFPAVDGTTLVDSNQVGREPGFNWTLKAKNFKNSSYESSPLDYAKRIQDKGYTIYSDDSQLDYKFHLTPAVLRELKANYSNDYTKYSGNSYTDSNGVIRYISNLSILDDPAITLKSPTDAALKCNNIKNRNECEGH